MPSKDQAEAVMAKLLGTDTDNAALHILLGTAKKDAAPQQEEDEPDNADGLPTDGEDADAEAEDDMPEVEDDGDDAETGDEPDEAEEPEFETLEYRDDDLIVVKVDGEDREVTLADLKKAFSGEGAIDKRLQEATETRKAAQVERDAVRAELEANRVDLMQSIAQLDSVLFRPLVPPPNPQLRATNINAYLMQKDAYEDDQKRISTSQAQVAGLFQQERDRKVKQTAAYRADQTRLLLERAPELADPKAATEFRDDLVVMAQHYGFNEEELAGVDNHAMLLVARDAGRYLKMMQGKTNKTLDSVPTGGAVIKRRLKAGAPTAAAAKPAAVQANKAYNKAAATARKTGSVEDVTAMLLANPNNKRRTG